ncbi:hypothetical protein GKE82_24145 [Conexibacter sp. W3-3-2]|uniref:hypothetical protein n=1 Tax=Conexibacter sp. W3-3-2 TaxID=2675227 RepID=UPI0012B93109|nr:hypothetical protein [Conexibacter sp. W3-3-2]MTD47300.1 hypothetical protein [Conexibacter sp. W3-3-2]
MLDDWTRRERAVAEGIAYVVWRWRNPAAGTFDPISDRGHRGLVDAAVALLRLRSSVEKDRAVSKRGLAAEEDLLERCDHCGNEAVTVQLVTGRAACDDHAREVFPECFGPEDQGCAGDQDQGRLAMWPAEPPIPLYGHGGACDRIRQSIASAGARVGCIRGEHADALVRDLAAIERVVAELEGRAVS